MIVVIVAGILGLWLAGNRHRAGWGWLPPPIYCGCPTRSAADSPASSWLWGRSVLSACATTDTRGPFGTLAHYSFRGDRAANHRSRCFDASMPLLFGL